MKKLMKTINNKANALAIGAKTKLEAMRNAACSNARTALVNKSGEGYIDTAVKIIVGVVVGGVLLVGLYALFKNVILVNLNTEIADMFDYTA